MAGEYNNSREHWGRWNKTEQEGYTEIYAFITRKMATEKRPMLFNVKNGELILLKIYVYNITEPLYLRNQPLTQGSSLRITGHPQEGALFEEYYAEVLLSESKRLDKLISMSAPTDILLKENQKNVQRICSLNENIERPIMCLEPIKIEACPKADIKSKPLRCIRLPIPYRLYLISKYEENKYKNLRIIRANPENVKSVLEHVLKNQDMLPLLGSDGRDYVEENHNPDREVKKLLNIYKSKRV